jgi:hypothetical protein
VIEIRCDTEAEARVMTRLLTEGVRPDWAYQVLVGENLYASRQALVPAWAMQPDDPRLVMIRQLVRAAGQAGITEPQLRGRLKDAGFTVDRQSVRSWLEADAGAGLVLHTELGWAVPASAGEAGPW